MKISSVQPQRDDFKLFEQRRQRAGQSFSKRGNIDSIELSEGAQKFSAALKRRRKPEQDRFRRRGQGFRYHSQVDNQSYNVSTDDVVGSTIGGTPTNE